MKRASQREMTASVTGVTAATPTSDVIVAGIGESFG